MGRSGIRAAYATGKGRIIVRGKTEIEEVSNGKFRIVITEIPYKVRKEALVKKIYDLAAEKRIDGIDDVVDYSSKRDGGIKIVVDLKKDVNAQVVLNKIYSYTQLQTTFGAILLAIVNGKPQILTLKEMLQNCIDFQCEIITRRTLFDKHKAEERAHILEALKVALDFIDEVINIIRASKTIAESKEALCARFNFDDVQATAIVQMQLGKLAGMEKQKIEDELLEKHNFIKECEEILASKERILDIVKTESLNLRDKFVDDRRTEITAVTGEVDIEDLIPNDECIITRTKEGYIKRLTSDTYGVQHRGGRGIMGMTTREDDYVETMFTCHAHDNIMLFSNLGRVYKLKAYEIPEGSRTSKGMNVINIVQLMANEKITVILPVLEIDDSYFVTMGTKNGIIKRTSLEAFKHTRKTGVIAISLDDGDALSFVDITKNNSELLVATKKGKAIKFKETDIRPSGRTSRGIRAIRLSEGDSVVGMQVCDEQTDILTVTETGFGRISKATDYRLQTRGGKGITNYRSAKYGDVAGIIKANEGEDVIIISTSGVIIRIPVMEISSFARPAKGVRVMRPGENEKVLALAAVVHDEEEVTDHPDAPDEDAGTVTDEEKTEKDNSVPEETEE